MSNGDSMAMLVETQGREIARLKARIAALEQERQWRPIETAPKDGHQIVVWNGKEAIGAWWSRQQWQWCDGWHSGEVRPAPVAWMLPPAQADGRGRE